jgi:Putative DNA-binding domain
MSYSIEDKIKKIVSDKTNEKCILDYKVKEYDLGTKSKWEMIKDIIAMLNSEEAFGEHKFIILGIAEKEFYVKGLERNMRDDNEYQHLFEFIEPRPKIETGQVFIENKTIGYIFIDKINDERPYTIAKDNEKYCKGTSFIRKGSINISLNNETREKLILKKFIKKSNVNEIYQNILDKNALKSEVIYKNKDSEGKEKIDPSNNNGKFTIGEGLFEFKIKFDVANNGVARVYNDYGIQVSRIKNKGYLFDRYQEIAFEKLDFTDRLRRYETSDLAVIVNRMGKFALLAFINIDSESHGANSDLIEFKWKII